MKIRIFACPECRCRKFVSLNALNVHMTKAHTLNYKIILSNNKAYRKLKQARSRAVLVKVKHAQKRPRKISS